MINLLDILCRLEYPVAVYTWEEILIELVDPDMMSAWSRSEPLIGKTLSAALSEISDQPFVGMPQEVLRISTNNVGSAVPAEHLIDGRLLMFYFDYAHLASKIATAKSIRP